MRALSSRRFGALSVHPLATKPIPMDYRELLAEIDHTERQLAERTDEARPGDRVARALRLENLKAARTSWDEAVRDSELTMQDLATGGDVADPAVEV